MLSLGLGIKVLPAHLRPRSGPKERRMWIQRRWKWRMRRRRSRVMFTFGPSWTQTLVEIFRNTPWFRNIASNRLLYLLKHGESCYGCFHSTHIHRGMSRSEPGKTPWLLQKSLYHTCHLSEDMQVKCFFRKSSSKAAVHFPYIKYIHSTLFHRLIFPWVGKEGGPTPPVW